MAVSQIKARLNDFLLNDCADIDERLLRGVYQKKVGTVQEDTPKKELTTIQRIGKARSCIINKNQAGQVDDYETYDKTKVLQKGGQKHGLLDKHNNLMLPGMGRAGGDVRNRALLNTTDIELINERQRGPRMSQNLVGVAHINPQKNDMHNTASSITIALKTIQEHKIKSPRDKE